MLSQIALLVSLIANGAAAADPSLYEILGVRPNASVSEIRAAYGLKVRELRAAVGQRTVGSMDQHLNLYHAYQVLKDTEQRRIYDYYLSLSESGNAEAAKIEGQAFERRREIPNIEFEEAVLNQGNYTRLVSQVDEFVHSNRDAAAILESVTKGFHRQASSRTPFWIHRPHYYLLVMTPAPVFGAIAGAKTGSATLAGLFFGSAALAGTVAIAQWEMIRSSVPERAQMAGVYAATLGLDPTPLEAKSVFEGGDIARALIAFDLWTQRYFDRVVPRGSRRPSAEAFLFMKNSILLGEKMPWLAHAVLIRYLADPSLNFESLSSFEYLFGRNPRFWQSRAEEVSAIFEQTDAPQLASARANLSGFLGRVSQTSGLGAPLRRLRGFCQSLLINITSVQRNPRPLGP